MSDDPMLALRRARRAWERTQPQLFLDLDGLEAGEVKRAAVPLPLRPAAAASLASSPSNPRRRRRMSPSEQPRDGGLE